MEIQKQDKAKEKQENEKELTSGLKNGFNKKERNCQEKSENKEMRKKREKSSNCIKAANVLKTGAFRSN